MDWTKTGLTKTSWTKMNWTKSRYTYLIYGYYEYAIPRGGNYSGAKFTEYTYKKIWNREFPE